MNAPITALVFVGLMLAVIGLFVAGNVGLIGLGVASLFGAGVLQAVGERSAR